MPSGGVQAYITTNNQGVINWSTVVDTYCYTDVHQMIWFYAPSIAYSRIDANRTLSWEGSGNYYSNLEGVYLYLYSGTQYAEFYASSYVWFCYIIQKEKVLGRRRLCCTEEPEIPPGRNGLHQNAKALNE